MRSSVHPFAWRSALGAVSIRVGGSTGLLSRGLFAAMIRDFAVRHAAQ
jgi:hypothetical protein